MQGDAMLFILFWKIDRFISKYSMENAQMLIFSIISAAILHLWDPFGLQERFPIEVSIGVYTLAGFFIWYIIHLAAVSIARRNIRLTEAFDKIRSIKLPFGSSHYAVLLVTPPPEFDITNCYAVLDKVTPVLDENGNELNYNTIQLDIVKSNHVGKRLLWAEKHEGIKFVCKTDIKGGENGELLIAQINIGSAGKNYQTNIQNLELCKCEDSDLLAPIRRGVYEISVSIHWSLDGKEKKPIIYDGYLFATIRENEDGGIVTNMYTRSGDWRKDSNIINLQTRHLTTLAPDLRESGQN